MRRFGDSELIFKFFSAVLGVSDAKGLWESIINSSETTCC